MRAIFFISLLLVINGCAHNKLTFGKKHKQIETSLTEERENSEKFDRSKTVFISEDENTETTTMDNVSDEYTPHSDLITEKQQSKLNKKLNDFVDEHIEEVPVAQKLVAKARSKNSNSNTSPVFLITGIVFLILAGISLAVGNKMLENADETPSGCLTGLIGAGFYVVLGALLGLIGAILLIIALIVFASSKM